MPLMSRRCGNALVVAIAIALAIAGAGCGEEEDKAPRESVQALVENAGTEGAQATVEKFFDAGNERDAATICSLVTKDQAEAFGRAAGDCVSGMKALLEAEDPPRTEVIIEDVRVRGERATVDATITQAGETRPTSLSLIQEDGDWKLTDPGL